MRLNYVIPTENFVKQCVIFFYQQDARIIEKLEAKPYYLREIFDYRKLTIFLLQHQRNHPYLCYIPHILSSKDTIDYHYPGNIKIVNANVYDETTKSMVFYDDWNRESDFENFTLGIRFKFENFTPDIHFDKNLLFKMEEEKILGPPITLSQANIDILTPK